MIDQSTPKGRVAAAALALAAERAWRDVTLRDIAERAGFGLAGLREHAATKGEVIALIARAIDDQVVENAPRPVAGEGKRDALFEVVMARFDALTPYKAAVRSIVSDASTEPAAIRAMLASQGWMLQAAGIDSGGFDGGVRVAGMTSVYASVLRTWLDDDDPGLAHTMAALDRRLRRGERTLALFDDVAGTLRRVGEGVASMVGGAARPRHKPAPPAAADHEASPAPDLPINA